MFSMQMDTPKQARVAILISYKIDFQLKLIKTYGEEHLNNKTNKQKKPMFNISIIKRMNYVTCYSFYLDSMVMQWGRTFHTHQRKTT